MREGRDYEKKGKWRLCQNLAVHLSCGDRWYSAKTTEMK